ncbi:hypothetical protein [Clostridium sp. Marseille-P299]|uniref:hypothetical protein n=1 Tax=Clostridium sp. Marseille-P299 TaxID=1805477 RepID=UPI00083585A6|nr:hypothetical protein [Clostridium sp. Marseille-P299]
MARGKYRKDYESHIEVQGKRKKKTLIYKGKYYKIDINQEELKNMKIKYAIFSALTMLAFIFVGLQNTEGSRKFYIILPYIFTFLPIFYEIMGTIKLITNKQKMTFVEYDTSIQRIKRSTIGILIFSLSSSFGEIIFLITNKITDVRSLEYRALSGILFMSLISFLFLQQQKKYKCVEV